MLNQNSAIAKKNNQAQIHSDQIDKNKKEKQRETKHFQSILKQLPDQNYLNPQSELKVNSCERSYLSQVCSKCFLKQKAKGKKQFKYSQLEIKSGFINFPYQYGSISKKLKQHVENSNKSVSEKIIDMSLKLSNKNQESQSNRSQQSESFADIVKQQSIKLQQTSRQQPQDLALINGDLVPIVNYQQYMNQIKKKVSQIITSEGNQQTVQQQTQKTPTFGNLLSKQKDSIFGCQVQQDFQSIVSMSMVEAGSQCKQTPQTQNDNAGGSLLYQNLQGNQQLINAKEDSLDLLREKKQIPSLNLDILLPVSSGKSSEKNKKEIIMHFQNLEEKEEKLFEVKSFDGKSG